MRLCALACVGERTSGQAGKGTGTFILYVFRVSFFFLCRFSLRLHFVCFFFVPAEIFDLFAMIEGEFCFAFLVLVLFFFFAVCVCMCFVRAPAAINLYM